MPFPFSLLCKLLAELEDITNKHPHPTAKILNKKLDDAILKWFRTHRVLIDAPDTDGVALLSSLLPEKRTDRVYNLQPPSLTKILGRTFLLGSSRVQSLYRWQIPGAGDLGQCVEKVLNEAPFSPQSQNAVTLEEIDATLNHIATRCRFSGPDIKGRRDSALPVNVDGKLSAIYYRLSPREAKWFTRMILKCYSPVSMPEACVLRYFHHLLPGILKIHDSFDTAVPLLRSFSWASAMPTPAEARVQKSRVLQHVRPVCGVKIGRPYFLKGWSVKHVTELAHERRMCLERKYDGEYMQIHVDLTKRDNEIQIFSKNGRDSTLDRRNVHAAIKDALKLGKYDCEFANECILEGELVVWSDKEQKILDFHKVRKHVDRGGLFLGTSEDSQPHPWEHLMVVFFDVLKVDEDPLLFKTYKERRETLERIVTIIPGRSDLVRREVINFSSRKAPDQLLKALATCFAHRWEGYVLKPYDEPYVSFDAHSDGDFRSCWIKLKKDKIAGLGDTAEFAIIGARYDPADATRLGVPKLPWTSFYIGCLRNKHEVRNQGAKPRFTVMDALSNGISSSDMEKLCNLGKFYVQTSGTPEALGALELDSGSINLSQMQVIFTEPFVVEVKGTGFDKPPNTGHLMLRFPRVVKIHWDRTYEETVGFDELQVMAKEAMNAPEGGFEDDVTAWEQKLRRSERSGEKKPCWVEGMEHSDTLIEDNDAKDDSTESKETTPRASFTESTTSSRHVPGTFIRMDTTEMLPGDTRLESGEVVSASVTTSFNTSFSSAKTSPRHSSRLATQASQEEAVKLAKRRRSSTVNISPPALKRARTSLEAGDAEPTQVKEPDRRAMRVISNSSTVTTSESFCSSAGLSLVSKIPALSVKRRSERSRASVADLQTSFAETTASEASSPTPSPQPVAHTPPRKGSRTASEACSSTASSRSLSRTPRGKQFLPHPSPPTHQRAANGSPTRQPLRRSYLNKRPPNPPPMLRPNSSSADSFHSTKEFFETERSSSPDLDPKGMYATPPPTAPNVASAVSSLAKPSTIASMEQRAYNVPAIPKLSFPNLTILSPCLRSTPYLTEDILPQRQADVYSLELLLQPQNSLMIEESSILNDDTEVIALVESNRASATAAFMRELTPLARKGCAIQVWDWRVLEKGKAKKWFIGWVTKENVRWHHCGGKSVLQ